MLRTYNKQYIKRQRTKKHKYNRSLKQTHDYDPIRNSFPFSAPLNFSFIHNASETAEFFQKILKFITDSRHFEKSIYVDISKITTLTIDALMYLLAIVNNLNKKFAGKYSFSGNSPVNENTRDLFIESGFFKYVKRRGNAPIQQNRDNVQIVSGTNSDTDVAKRMSEFVCRLANVDKSKCKFLYIMMIELMSNTDKHAYDDYDNILEPHWYCFAEYDKQDTISFTFMDTGEGIPSTVQKNFSEKIDILKLKGEDKYVISALNGDFRTSTKQAHRGKGLPKIRSFCAERKIQNLRIITNKAKLIVEKDKYISEIISPALKGTLYYWEIKLSQLKGECI